MVALMADEVERCADPLDDASRVTQSLIDGYTAHAAYLSAPEQEMNPDGTWPITECVSCGCEIDAGRLALAKVRCVRCQELLERHRRGVFRGQ